MSAAPETPPPRTAEDMKALVLAHLRARYRRDLKAHGMGGSLRLRGRLQAWKEIYQVVQHTPVAGEEQQG